MFCKVSPAVDAAAVTSAVGEISAGDHQVVSFAVLGHKADLGFMALGPDIWQLRRLQTLLHAAGLIIADSYVSVTEISEYAEGLPDDMKSPRLYPELPPEGKPAYCFYPMSKRREGDDNWFRLPFDERKELMYEHGASGRKFRGRIVQLITGSTGVDDYEWGVTLFGEHLDDLKDVVYTLRFDEASARYAVFGDFYTGLVCEVDELMKRLDLA